MDDQQLVGLANARKNRVLIHGDQSPQVQHFDRYAFPLQHRSRFETLPHHRRPGHDRQLAPFPSDPSLPDRRQELLTLREVLLDSAIQIFVLEEDDGIVVSNRRLDQSFRVPDRRRRHQLQAGRMEERRLGHL